MYNCSTAILYYACLAAVLIVAVRSGGYFWNTSDSGKVNIKVGQALRKQPVSVFYPHQRNRQSSPVLSTNNLRPAFSKSESEPGLGKGLSLPLRGVNGATNYQSPSLNPFLSASVRRDSEFGPSQSRDRKQYGVVNLRLMGQPIDPGIVGELHPDVSSKKVRKLRRLLVGELDKSWTSEEPPRILRQRGVPRIMSETSYPLFGQTQYVDPTLVQKVDTLNMTFKDRTGAQFLLPEAQIRLFRNWLLEQATCEMDFIWKDLGSLYWPRWIRMGVCLNRYGKSCSWPPGMKCQPFGSRLLKLLHWKCENTARTEGESSLNIRSSREAVDLPMGRGTFQAFSPKSVISLTSRGEASGTPKGDKLSIHAYQPRSYWARNYRSYEKPSGGEVERKTQKANRLVKKLSVSSYGYYCHWQVQKYLISDKCTCSCA